MLFCCCTCCWKNDNSMKNLKAVAKWPKKDELTQLFLVSLLAASAKQKNKSNNKIPLLVNRFMSLASATYKT